MVESESTSLEQRAAIEHEGGILLEAGAGSGKTTVLIEHLVYLFRKILLKYNDAELGENLRREFAKIVVMTFTTKAAGELFVRLNRKIGDLVQEETELPWISVKDSLGTLFVGTIHSFCLRLIKQGLMAGMRTDVAVSSIISTRKILEILFLRWCGRELDSEANSSFRTLVIHVFLVKKDKIIDSLEKLFCESTHRVAWSLFEREDFFIKDLDRYIKDAAEIFQFLYCYQDKFDLNHSHYQKNSDKKWFEFIQSFSHYQDIHSWDDLWNAENFFESWGRFPPAPKNDESIKEYFDSVKNLREFLKNHSENLKKFLEYQGTVYTEWVESCKNLMEFIHKNYLSMSSEFGISFADMEYYVRLNLDNDQCRNRLDELYRYFIIDEFQDTSRVQYEIIGKIINFDFSRLFCVGDIKQAIYGFRGGEADIFVDCSKKVRATLSLKNNYRSFKEITEFNNAFFEWLLPRIEQFEFSESFDFIFTRQNSMKTGTGAVKRMLLGLGDDSDPDFDPNEVEAEVLSNEIIKTLKSIRVGETVAVLYRKMTPSVFLTEKLKNKGVNYTVQTRIPYGEDPVIAIYALLLEGLLAGREEISRYLTYLKLLLPAYLKYFSIELPSIPLMEDRFDRFKKDVALYGSIIAYQRFLFSLHLSNSNLKSFAFLSELVRVCSDDPEHVLIVLGDSIDQDYPMEFESINSNDQKTKVIIMTVHASKGLEFDHVFLAGIQTNGRDKEDSFIFAKGKGCFQWKYDMGENFLNSPALILHKAHEKKKNFNESKRLFYVACTRSKQTLNWMEFENYGKIKNFSKNSWANALHKFFGEFPETPVETIQIQAFELESNRRDHTYNFERPFFHTDPSGITKKLFDQESILALVPDLSVTRLSLLAECPLKFYMKNVCRIESEDVELMEEIVPKVFYEKLPEEEEDFKSSTERGSRIHALISLLINNNLEMEESFFKEYPKTVSDIVWVRNQLMPKFRSSGTQFISERPLKFMLFSYMISGIPDLIVINSETDNLSDSLGPIGPALEIWDFKTGSRHEKNETAYWFQLYCYAYAAYELGMIDRDKEVVVKLCYVDQQLNVEKVARYPYLKEKLADEWIKLSTLDMKNPAHCGFCLYKVMCKDN